MPLRRYLIALALVTATAWLIWQGSEAKRVEVVPPLVVARPVAAEASQAQTHAKATAPVVPSAQATAPPGLTPASLDWPTHVDSSGWGPTIERALRSDDPRLALMAARQIHACRQAEHTEEELRQPELIKAVPPATLKMILEAKRAEQRRCQTVLPSQVRAQWALAQRAAQARLPGAAMQMVHALSDPPDPAQMDPTRQALRAAVARGEAEPLMLLSQSGAVWGIDAIEQRSYWLLTERLGGWHLHPQVRLAPGPEQLKALADPAQEQAAQARLEALWAQCCAGRP